MNIFFILIIIIILFVNNYYEYFESTTNKKCCIIKTEYVKDPNNIPLGGSFQYRFNETDNCDNNTHKWSNKNCNNNNNILGSCRYSNKECIDYMTNEECDKYKEQGMIWSNKTCHDNIFPSYPLYNL